MKNIFEAIEDAAEKLEENKEIDLGLISKLADKQAMYEGPVDEDEVFNLNEYIINNDVSVASIEEVLKARKKQLFEIKQRQIPEIMRSFGLDSIKTSSGNEIKIVGDISVTRRDNEKLFRFMRDNDAGDLIKNQIIVTVDSEAERRYISNRLEAENVSFETKEDVHSATLKKYLKDLKAEGKVAPEDAVSVFDFEYSKIKKGKK